MDDLIDALCILRKYGNHQYPTNCSHDLLVIAHINPSEVSDEDKKRLEECGFDIDSDLDLFVSHRFGSA